MSDLLERVAGAPITWGVDGSPGWGYLMDPDRVLREMVESGLSATELGPDGYLPTDPAELQDYLGQFDLSIVGGFVPALLYRPDQIEAQLEYVTRAARQLASTGSKVLVLGPSSHHPGYDTSVDMNNDEWTAFLTNLRRLEAVVNDAGLETALHPHWGMAIETGKHIDRLLESSSVGLCLDTGHVYLAGTDPVEVARAARGRVLHVHLKDLDPAKAAQVRSGEVPFRESVIDGLFVPLGQGGVDIAGVIAALETDGYRGWYVIEQDVSLKGEPPVGEGPKADAVDSVAYLSTLAGGSCVSQRALSDLEATCVLPAGAQLGECPTWSPDDARLYWIDIDGRAIHRYDPASGLDEQRPAPGRPGSLALTANPGRLLVALEGRLGFFDWPSGAWREWIALEPEGVGNRLNDGRCDPAGRFWVGSMFDPAAAGHATGMLHRIEPDGSAVTVRSGIGVANGLAFSPDGRTMYFADTPRETVWAYDYDVDTGEATNERVFLDFGPLPGRPDGAAVDEAGCYWIACVLGGMILRITPAGAVDRRIRVPVSKPTMPAFGGRGLATLFITTIGGGGSHEVDPSESEAGGLFAIEPGVSGLPEPRFGGDPDVGLISR